MKLTKKNQIIEFYNKGLSVEDIVNKGFDKKYINQVLKKFKASNFIQTSNKNFNINDIKELASVLESLTNKSDNINVKINISIKLEACNTNPVDTKSSLLNPVTVFRDVGENKLREKLMLLNIKDLITIAKTYTPDLNGKIYRQKNANIIIDYIIERSSKLSKVGQVFRSTQ